MNTPSDISAHASGSAQPQAVEEELRALLDECRPYIAGWPSNTGRAIRQALLDRIDDASAARDQAQGVVTDAEALAALKTFLRERERLSAAGDEKDVVWRAFQDAAQLLMSLGYVRVRGEWVAPATPPAPRDAEPVAHQIRKFDHEENSWGDWACCDASDVKHYTNPKYADHYRGKVEIRPLYTALRAGDGAEDARDAARWRWLNKFPKSKDELLAFVLQRDPAAAVDAAIAAAPSRTDEGK